ncbi:MAG TPA: hypothetical protein GXZ52_01850 [Clostridiales bacterium]|nr:hypothetical protein [Clostridiales bacterium]
MPSTNCVNYTYPSASANKFAEAGSACSKMGTFAIIMGAAFAASIFLIALIFLIISVIVSILLSVVDVIIVGIISLIVSVILVIIIAGLHPPRLKEPKPTF